MFMQDKIKPWSINHTKFLLPHEVLHLQRVLNRKMLPPTRREVRDKLMLRLALSTGIRASELTGLEKSFLNPNNNSIFVNALKNGIDREMPLTASFFSELVHYSGSVPGGLIFPIGYDTLAKRVWKMYRPCRKKFHSLRHTFAVRLYLETKDIHLVKAALGHRSIDNTMVYLDYCYHLKEMRRITAVAI